MRLSLLDMGIATWVSMWGVVAGFLLAVTGARTEDKWLFAWAALCILANTILFSGNLVLDYLRAWTKQEMEKEKLGP